MKVVINNDNMENSLTVTTSEDTFSPAIDIINHSERKILSSQLDCEYSSSQMTNDPNDDTESSKIIFHFFFLFYVLSDSRKSFIFCKHFVMDGNSLEIFKINEYPDHIALSGINQRYFIGQS